MAICRVCASQNFEMLDGFLYCQECQTQSQDFQEQGYEFKGADHVSKKRKVRKTKHKESKRTSLDGSAWLSWEALNYVLHGMTQEMIANGTPKKYENVVLELWSCYLKRNEVAFMSHVNEKIPKLGIDFKKRDAKVLYGLDGNLLKCKKTSSRRSPKKSDTGTSAISSVTSNRSLLRKRKKLLDRDYEEHLSSTLKSEGSTSLADETLESLGRSFDSESSMMSATDNDSVSTRSYFTDEAYKALKDPTKSRTAVIAYQKKVKHISKNKLLSILHLALILTESELQLSDLLRFIREGHLSFAKVTHFLPKEMSFIAGDVSYIESSTDSCMPGHGRQRETLGKLAYFLGISSLPCTNIDRLIIRYCRDLELPVSFRKYTLRLLASMTVEKSCVVRSKFVWPCFEGKAMALIIFNMKLLFGLNDRKEIVLSKLARKFNSQRSKDQSPELFVFQDWQNYLEYRKTLLNHFHYPTQEQLALSDFSSSRNFIDALIKESKDEGRDQRFMTYPEHFIQPDVLKGIENVVSELSRPHETRNIEFQPSLTPQLSYMESISNALSNEADIRLTSFIEKRVPNPLLRKNFSTCSVDFAFKASEFIGLLIHSEPDNKEIEQSDLLCSYLIKRLDEGVLFGDMEKTYLESQKFDSIREDDLSHVQLAENTRFFSELRERSEREVRLDSRYWTYYYPSFKSNLKEHFQDEVFEKTPFNFQWILGECARMIEMSVRDLYNELLSLECHFEKQINS